MCWEFKVRGAIEQEGKKVNNCDSYLYGEKEIWSMKPKNY